MRYFYAIASLALVLTLIPLLGSVARSIGLLDHPDSRKQHVGAVPLIGGWAILLAVAITLLLFDRSLAAAPTLVLGCLGLALIGSLDDRWPMSSLLRFVLQAGIIAAVFSATGAVLGDLGNLLGIGLLTLGVWALPFTVFGALGVVNAVNLIDGADGLAGGISATGLAAFLTVFHTISARQGWPAGVFDPTALCIALLGAVVGFLWFNLRTPWRPHAAVFLGDAGSLLLGFVLAWMAVFACGPQLGNARLSPACALWFIMVPLFDTIYCMTRRVLQGRSPMAAERNHVHHLLQRCGLTTGQTVALLIAVNGASCLIGVAGWQNGVADHLMFAAFAACFVLYAALATRSWAKLGEIGRRIPAHFVNTSVESATETQTHQKT